MAAALSITAVSKKTMVPAATLRYWERLGLLPRAARTHTGYRVFAGEVLQYVDFVRRSKAMGLSLRQMRRVLEVARAGRTPCPEVEEWIRTHLQKIKEQIRELRALEERLLAVSRDSCVETVDSGRASGLCSLIVGLPEERNFRERNKPEPSFDDQYERRQRNVPSSRTTR